jgi:hypothetical protein
MSDNSTGAPLFPRKIEVSDSWSRIATLGFSVVLVRGVVTTRRVGVFLVRRRDHRVSWEGGVFLRNASEFPTSPQVPGS